MYVTELVAQVGHARAEDALRAELAEVERALSTPTAQNRSALEATRARLESYLSDRVSLLVNPPEGA